MRSGDSQAQPVEQRSQAQLEDRVELQLEAAGETTEHLRERRQSTGRRGGGEGGLVLAHPVGLGDARLGLRLRLGLEVDGDALYEAGLPRARISRPCIIQREPQLSAVLQELVLRGQRDPETGAAFRARHDGWNRGIESILRAEIAKGTLRPDLDPPIAARVITSFIVGAFVPLGVNPEAFDFRIAADMLDAWLQKKIHSA